MRIERVGVEMIQSWWQSDGKLNESVGALPHVPNMSVAKVEALGARTLLGTPGIATRSKDTTRGSWHRY